MDISPSAKTFVFQPVPWPGQDSNLGNQVLQQAVDELEGKYAADAAAFAPYIQHILNMADLISNGIIAQFPAKFR